MKTRSFYLTLTLLLVCLWSNISFGDNVVWTNGCPWLPQEWNESMNWSLWVPIASDYVYISMTGGESPIINIGVNASAKNVFIGSSLDYPGNGELNILGGNLTVGSNIYVGYNGYTGTINLNGGTINVTNKLAIGGAIGSTGNVIINGGLINTKLVDLPSAGAGHLQVDGGVLKCTFEGGFTVNAGGSGDITGGELQLTGEVTSLSSFSGWGVPGALVYSYNGSTNITTITADPQYSPIAHHPNPANGTTDAPVNLTELRWIPPVCAVTQDFYFGTSFDEVNDSIIPTTPDLPGTATSVAVPEVLQKYTTYYWRIDADCGAGGIHKGQVWVFTTTNKVQFCDDFEVEHDYLASGTTGTYWDGIIGKDYILALSTDYNAGRLYIESGSNAWADNSQGALLYKEIVGDWIATVELTDYSGLWTADHTDAVYHNNCGLMARVGDIAAAGAGEDWFSIDYFPIWGVGISVRWNDNGVRTDGASETDEAWDAGRWLKLTRTGNSLDAYSSHNGGLTWERNPNMPRLRTDMAGLPLQVGLHHATFSGSAGYAEFDDFCISRQPTETAYSPLPTSGGTIDLMSGIISWIPGDLAGSHNVYFGNDYNDVNDANTISDPEYRGPDNVEGPDASGRFSYNAGLYETLVIGNTYYWRIDEVNNLTVWKGSVWRFTVQDYTTIDSFERYIETGNVGIGVAPPAGTLRKVWIDGLWSATKIVPAPPPSQPQYKITSSASFVQINTDPCDGKPSRRQFNNSSIALLGKKSMKFYYENDGFWQWWIWLYGSDAVLYKFTAPNFSEVFAAIDDAARQIPATQESLGLKRNWSGYKLLRIPFYGDPNNTLVPTDKMYVGLWDGDNNPTTPVVITHPDNTLLQKNWWQDWYIPLSSFPAANANFSLSNVARIYIGVGNRTTPAAGGIGNIFFDELQLLSQGVCIPGTQKTDFNNDCRTDMNDLEALTKVWLGTVPTMPTPIINLDASTLGLGPLNSWSNTGSLGGVFDDFNSIVPGNNPTVATVEGKKAVVFDGNDLLIWKTAVGGAIKLAPATLTSDHNDPNDYTIIAEVLNHDIANEEYYFAWARNGGDGTCASFGYGTSWDFGATAHWYWRDMGFGLYSGFQTPAAHVWHKIAVTYDGTTETVIVDGVIREAEDKDLLIYQNNPVTVGCRYDYDTGTLVVTPSFNFSGAVASVKVYGQAVAPANLAMLMGSPINLISDSTINFKDLAVLANKWLVGPVLLGQ